MLGHLQLSLGKYLYENVLFYPGTWCVVAEVFWSYVVLITLTWGRHSIVSLSALYFCIDIAMCFTLVKASTLFTQDSPSVALPERQACLRRPSNVSPKISILGSAH